MIASWSWGNGRTSVREDIIKARQALGRHDRGYGSPHLDCAPDVWAAVVGGQEANALWALAADVRSPVLAKLITNGELDTSLPFYFEGSIRRCPSMKPGTCNIIFSTTPEGQTVTVEECV